MAFSIEGDQSSRNEIDFFLRVLRLELQTFFGKDEISSHTIEFFLRKMAVIVKKEENRHLKQCLQCRQWAKRRLRLLQNQAIPIRTSLKHWNRNFIAVLDGPN